jgi:hypothetical protein
MYLKFTSTPPCLKWGRLPRDPHHFRFVQTRAVARKVSDEFTVPPCREKVPRNGPSATAACACSNAGRCRRSDIFR